MVWTGHRSRCLLASLLAADGAGDCLRRCIWCQTAVHDDCEAGLEGEGRCDLGEFRSLIIPPHYLHHVNKLRRRHPDEYVKVGGALPHFSARGITVIGNPVAKDEGSPELLLNGCQSTGSPMTCNDGRQGAVPFFTTERRSCTSDWRLHSYIFKVKVYSLFICIL